ncbi:MAG: threonine/serine exporter family protein [Clostridia bacterium]|nr:threonine/serine exporter family protein [Clostridia bacterium]MBQ7117295.1 threonine/serine exporter family protein [Clostridia bacterium]
MELKEIFTLLISGVIGTVGFSILFKSNKSRVFSCAVGGALVILIYIGCVNVSDNLFFQNFVPSLFATVYAEIMARVMKAPTTPILACSIIALIPGYRLYYTTYYFVTSNMDAFDRELMAMLQVAAGICVGITCISVIVNEINRHKFKQIFENR